MLYSFYIIPKIEKRLGKKLEFVLFGYNMNPLSKFYTYIEISWCIVRKYLMWKFNIGAKSKYFTHYNVVKPNCKWALWRSTYRIEDASWFEILISFYATINIICFTVYGFYFMFLHYLNKYFH